MKAFLMIAILAVCTTSLSGCFTGDYPHDEPSATCPDNHKSGTGTYGGTVSSVGSTAPNAGSSSN